MKLACDVMLGSLARWLRVCGIDVFYDAKIDRSGLFRIAREEGRTILTRAGNFKELKEIPPYIMIEKEELEDQLKQVKKAFPDLNFLKDSFTRCLECNELLTKIDKASAKDRIPPKAYELAGDFHQCPTCKKLFWPGTHVRRMKAKIDKIFEK
jgi:uncharacterized protein with PIN domain